MLTSQPVFCESHTAAVAVDRVNTPHVTLRTSASTTRINIQLRTKVITFLIAVKVSSII